MALSTDGTDAEDYGFRGVANRQDVEHVFSTGSAPDENRAIDGDVPQPGDAAFADANVEVGIERVAIRVAQPDGESVDRPDGRFIAIVVATENVAHEVLRAHAAPRIGRNAVSHAEAIGFRHDVRAAFFGRFDDSGRASIGHGPWSAW